MFEDPACCQGWENGEQMETQVLPKKQKDSGKHLHLALFERGAVQRREKQETDYYLEWVGDNAKHSPQKLSTSKNNAVDVPLKPKGFAVDAFKVGFGPLAHIRMRLVQ